MIKHEQDWDEFWKMVCTNPDGSINFDQVKKELSDYLFLLHEIPKVYVHITNGTLSKVMYKAESVIGYADQAINDQLEEIKKDILADIEVEGTENAVEIVNRHL